MAVNSLRLSSLGYPDASIRLALPYHLVTYCSVGLPGFEPEVTPERVLS